MKMLSLCVLLAIFAQLFAVQGAPADSGSSEYQIRFLDPSFVEAKGNTVGCGEALWACGESGIACFCVSPVNERRDFQNKVSESAAQEQRQSFDLNCRSCAMLRLSLRPGVAV